MNQQHISRQLKRFLITGIGATLIDLACYSTFLYLGMSFMLAKAASFLCAVSFAYIGHRSWTFMSHGSSSRLTAFSMLYLSALVINNVINLSMLETFGKEIEGIAISFVIATSVTATINFIVMKFLIFKPANQPEAETCSTEE